MGEHPSDVSWLFLPKVFPIALAATMLLASYLHTHCTLYTLMYTCSFTRCKHLFSVICKKKQVLLILLAADSDMRLTLICQFLAVTAAYQLRQDKTRHDNTRQYKTRQALTSTPENAAKASWYSDRPSMSSHLANGMCF